jgi:hypothetical protein
MTVTTPNLYVAKVTARRWGVVAGRSVITRHKSEAEALAALAADPKFYAYWAGSVSVSLENDPRPHTILGA